MNIYNTTIDYLTIECSTDTMMERCSLWCLLLKFMLLCVDVNTYSVSNQRTVQIRPSSRVKYINFPNSNGGAMIYMQIFRGVYPNIQDASFVAIGQPVSIIIFLIDDTGSHNFRVDECWAHDDPNLEFSKHKLSLTKKRSKGKKKIVSDWKQFKSPVEHKTLVYTNFTSFRFPEKEQIFFTCNVEIDRNLGSEIRHIWEPHYRLPKTESKYGSHIVKYKR